MGKYKEKPKYNVVSMRVSNEEKLALEEMMRKCNKSISRLMREAIQLYVPQLKTRTE
jgi:predicted transcriptional regulator